MSLHVTTTYDTLIAFVLLQCGVF